jgi:hypothetical protein
VQVHRVRHQGTGGHEEETGRRWQNERRLITTATDGFHNLFVSSL